MTTREMRKRGAEIPNCILFIIPLINFYWYWRYSAGVQKVTNGKWATGLVFLLFILTGIGGMILTQLAFNEDVSAEADSTAFPGKATAHTPEAAVQGVGVGAGVGAATESVKDRPETSNTAEVPEPPVVIETPPQDTEKPANNSAPTDTSTDNNTDQTVPEEASQPDTEEPTTEEDTTSDPGGEPPAQSDNNLPAL